MSSTLVSGGASTPARQSVPSEPLVIVHGKRAPGYPPNYATPPRMDYTPRPLSEVLTDGPYPPDTVICPIAWPSPEGRAFRPRKPWMLDARAEHTPYRLVMLDYDRPRVHGEKNPWKSPEEAGVAVEALHRAIVRTFGAAFTYASPNGVRSLFLTPSPVPLHFAHSWLFAALDAAPAGVVGLEAATPDRLTWTTGHRPL